MSYPTLQLVESGQLPTPADTPWIPPGEWSTRGLLGPAAMRGVRYDSHTIELYWKLTPDDNRQRGSTATGLSAFNMRMTHGGGTFLYRVCSHMIECQWPVWSALDDEPLYSIFYEIWKAHKEGVEMGEGTMSGLYRRAFAEGRLLKRKVRGQDRYEVWIAPTSEIEPPRRRHY